MNRRKLRNIFASIIGRFVRPTYGVHLLNCHYVSKEELGVHESTEVFNKFLDDLANLGQLISWNDAVDMITQQNIPSDKVYFALSFDDGFKECFNIIAPSLEERGVRGAFFINFGILEPKSVYLDGFNKRINIFDKEFMDRSEVQLLHQRGHIIGSHSLDHYNFSLLAKKESSFQISENKRLLEELLSYKCEHFAWPYGAHSFFPQVSLEIATKIHTHIYAGGKAPSYFSRNNLVLNRRHVEPSWPLSHLRFFTSKKK